MPRLRWVVAAGLVCTGVAAPSVAAGATDGPDWGSPESIDEFVQDQHAELRLSGLAVVVVADNDIYFEGTYGDAIAGAEGATAIPVTLDTPFLLGSTSKQFTGLAVQQLIADGRLSLDDTVGALLADLGGTSSPRSGVTVRQLLSHTSGLTTADGHQQWGLWPPSDSIEDEARRVLALPVGATGEAYQYSNANYSLLGAVIEQVTAAPFGEGLDALIASPLGISATTDLDLAHERRLADGHYTWYGLVDAVTSAPEPAAAAPSAFITASARDLTVLLRAHMGKPSGIDPAVLEAARAPLSRVNEYAEYASGWTVRPLWELTDLNAGWDDPRLPDVWEHAGTTMRSMTHLAVAPDLGLGVVVLTNTAVGVDESRIGTFAGELMHRVLGTEPPPASVDPLIAGATVLMIGVPVLQLGVNVWLTLTLRKPRRRGWRSWFPMVAGVVVTAISLTLALVVVPSRTGMPLLETAWWVGVPDLAVSVGLMLAFSAWTIVLLVCRLVRRPSRDARAHGVAAQRQNTYG